MLDDEDVLDDKGNKMKQFLSRQLVCASEEVSKIVAAQQLTFLPLTLLIQLRELWRVIDVVADPDPPTSYKTWFPGPDLDEPPKRRNKLAGRFRWWMVNEMWLAEETNWKFDKPSRSVGSGKAWGDLVDPEDEEAADNELKEMPRAKRRKGCKDKGAHKPARSGQPSAVAGPSNSVMSD
jgi:hypothetical protein